MFISFEGIDGSGKTTILNLLKEYAIKKYQNIDFVFSHEPGGTGVPEAEAIREVILAKDNKIDAKAEVLLYAASRRLHLTNLVWPSIRQGKIVISDRYVDSSYVYQGIARGIDLEQVKLINDFATDFYLPNKTFVFMIPKEISKQRRENRIVADRLDLSKEDFFDKIYDGYISLIKNDTNNRFIVIDASQNVDKVLKDTIEAFDKLINNWKNK